MICPNLSDPVIKEEFNKLKKAVGEVRAYDIWNKNNGYYLDKLPTGEDSNIFKDLVAKYGEEEGEESLEPPLEGVSFFFSVFSMTAPSSSSSSSEGFVLSFFTFSPI